MNKRDFLRTAGGAGLSLVFGPRLWAEYLAMPEQDYGHMLAQFKLEARRYGLVNKVVSVPMDPKSDDEVVQLYASAITPRTRLLMISHMVNITGQILPVRKVADMAHARGVDVLVDGAHAFAQF